MPIITKIVRIIYLKPKKIPFLADLIEESVKVLKCPDPTAKLNFNILARVLKSVNPPKETEK